MTIDWNSKKTSDLVLILGSLERYKNSAKTNREKRNTAKNIKAITEILNERKK